MKTWTLGLGLAAVLLAWGLASGQADASAGAAPADTVKKVLDINTATAKELDALPGIGEAYTRAIIQGRPYSDKRQLKWRKIIPRSTYEKIKDRITALVPKTEAKPAEAATPPAPAAKDKSSPKLVK